MRTTARRLLRASVAAVAALVIPIALAGSAAAISGSGGGTIIICTIVWNDPHGSTHVNGTVNATVGTSCTSPVAVISSFIRLTDLTNNRINAAGGSKSYGSKYNSGQSALSCLNATYQASGVVEVTFPPGYVPIYGEAEGASRAIYAMCGNITMASLEAQFVSGVSLATPSVPEVVTLTARKG